MVRGLKTGRRRIVISICLFVCLVKGVWFASVFPVLMDDFEFSFCLISFRLC